MNEFEKDYKWIALNKQIILGTKAERRRAYLKMHDLLINEKKYNIATKPMLNVLAIDMNEIPYQYNRKEIITDINLIELLHIQTYIIDNYKNRITALKEYITDTDIEEVYNNVERICTLETYKETVMDITKREFNPEKTIQLMLHDYRQMLNVIDTGKAKIPTITEDYTKKEAGEKEFNQAEKEWHEWRAKGFKTSFKTYLKHRIVQDDKYKSWMLEFAN